MIDEYKVNQTSNERRIIRGIRTSCIVFLSFYVFLIIVASIGILLMSTLIADGVWVLGNQFQRESRIFLQRSGTAAARLCESIQRVRAAVLK
jgi:hypothetical protein